MCSIGDIAHLIHSAEKESTVSDQHCTKHPRDDHREGFCGSCLDNYLAGEFHDSEDDGDMLDALSNDPDIRGQESWEEHQQDVTEFVQSTWVKRARANDLPTFDRHNGAFAYRAQ